jgi:signal transduction histidine kinase
MVKPYASNQFCFIGNYATLNNIVKHAKAHTVKVSFERDSNNIRISVEDDGMGFNAAKRHVSKNAGKGFGLFSIEERLSQLGGEFNIESRLKHGTRASLMLPLTAYKRSKSDKCWTGEKEIR